MSSFPDHEKNIHALFDMGFDVSNELVNGKVTFESWDYDELVYLMTDIVTKLKNIEFKLGENI